MQENILPTNKGYLTANTMWQILLLIFFHSLPYVFSMATAGHSW